MSVNGMAVAAVEAAESSEESGKVGESLTGQNALESGCERNSCEGTYVDLCVCCFVGVCFCCDRSMCLWHSTGITATRL